VTAPDEDLTARVRADIDKHVAKAIAAGVVVPPAEHGMRAGVKWPVRDDDEIVAWEGGYQCHCGELFVRTAAQGGIRAADMALIEHQGGTLVDP
jgi:hypothetical protein